MNLTEIEKVVAKIQSQLFKNANSYSIGMLKSHFRGSGLQFKEHQIYCHGDDVRFIDWKLYAKNNIPYIKTFEEERNLEVVVFIDLSLSMLIGYKNLSKLQAAINIACLIALLVKSTNDYVQFALLGEKDIISSKSNGKKSIVELVSRLREINIMKSDGSINIAYRPSNFLSQEKRFNIINRFVKQKKEVVILSDFNDFIRTEDLKQISYNKRAHCFKIVSPIEKGDVKNFNIYSFNSSKKFNTTSKLIKLNIENKKYQSQDSHLGLVEIDIQKRYMEDFVKGLI